MECAVCLDIFVDPRRLPCDHSLCLACVSELAKTQPLKFPVCRALHSGVKLEDVALLPQNAVLAGAIDALGPMLSRREALPDIRKLCFNAEVEGSGCAKMALFFCKVCLVYLCNICARSEHL